MRQHFGSTLVYSTFSSGMPDSVAIRLFISSFAKENETNDIFFVEAGIQSIQLTVDCELNEGTQRHLRWIPSTKENSEGFRIGNLLHWIV